MVWSVISAAFIGPGTVTTSVTAGSKFGLQLLWAVTFATLACYLLQELAARVVIASGMNLGQALLTKFGLRRGRTLQFLLGGSVIAGCAAYEAGNILGAVSGIQLISNVPTFWLTSALVVVAAIILWSGRRKGISNSMMALVVVIGVSFFLLAVNMPNRAIDVVEHAVVPHFPGGAALITLGLIGTTIVPYNIFVGSGISHGQTLTLMRTGLSVSIAIGGLVTAAILVAGTGVAQFENFQALASSFHERLGAVGVYALALGLFAAGFSSSITAPFAASVIVANVFQVRNRWWNRAAWMLVIATGFGFGVSGVRPIPIILLVQTLNGFILPLLVVFLVLMVNDNRVVPESFRPSPWYNLLLLAVLAVVMLLSANTLINVFQNVLRMHEPIRWIVAAVLSALVTIGVGWKTLRRRPPIT